MTYVCTLLIDLQSSDVKDPLAQFQATKATKEDIHQLMKNLNKALGEDSMDEALVNRAFGMWWPELEKELRNLPSDEAAPPPQRSEREMLQELLDKVRDISQTLQLPPKYLAELDGAREILSNPVNTSEQLASWRAVRNARTHVVPDAGALRRAVSTAFQSTGFENTEELNRALQLVTEVAIGQARHTREKKDAIEDGSKSPEEPKPVDRSTKGEHERR